MKKKIMKVRNFIERSLIRKNLYLKQEIKYLKSKKQELTQEIKELYNKISIQQEQYRELDIKQRNLIKKLKTSELFNELREILGDKE